MTTTPGGIKSFSFILSSRVVGINMEITLETLICWIIIGMSLVLLHSKQQIKNKIFHKIKHELNLVVGFWNIDCQMTYDSLHSLITLSYYREGIVRLIVTRLEDNFERYHQNNLVDNLRHYPDNLEDNFVH